MGFRRKLWDYCPKPKKRTKSHIAKARSMRKIVVLLSAALAVVLAFDVAFLAKLSNNVGPLLRSASSERLSKIIAPGAGIPPYQGRTIALPLPTYFSIDLNLVNREISIPRGQVQNIQVTIKGEAVANVTFSLEDEENPDPTSLPLGVSAVFNPHSLQIEPNSTATVQLNVYIGNVAAPGTYMLAVCGATRSTRADLLGDFGLGLTFILTIK